VIRFILFRNNMEDPNKLSPRNEQQTAMMRDLFLNSNQFYDKFSEAEFEKFEMLFNNICNTTLEGINILLESKIKINKDLILSIINSRSIPQLKESGLNNISSLDIYNFLVESYKIFKRIGQSISQKETFNFYEMQIATYEEYAKDKEKSELAKLFVTITKNQQVPTVAFINLIINGLD
jgi:hypothetical protein